MILILIALAIAFYLFYSTCRLHESFINVEKFHYQQQQLFYSTDTADLQELQEKLSEMKNLYENTSAKYTHKLQKLQQEMKQEIENYEVVLDEDFSKTMQKEIADIDISRMKQIVMGGA